MNNNNDDIIKIYIYESQPFILISGELGAEGGAMYAVACSALQFLDTCSAELWRLLFHQRQPVGQSFRPSY